MIDELTLFLNVLEGLQLEYPVFVDVEDDSLAALGRAQLTGLVRFAMDILYQRGWYAGWYSYTNFILNYLNAAELSQYPLWLADYRAQPGYTGSYAMWQYSSSGSVGGVTGACDVNNAYVDFLPTIRSGNFNGYGSSGPQMEHSPGRFWRAGRIFLHCQLQRRGRVSAGRQLYRNTKKHRPV